MGCISVFKPSSPGQQQSNMSANVVCCDSVLPLHYFKISSLKNNKWENSWMSTHTKFFSNKNTDFCVRHGCCTALGQIFSKTNLQKYPSRSSESSSPVGQSPCPPAGCALLQSSKSVCRKHWCVPLPQSPSP